MMLQQYVLESLDDADINTIQGFPSCYEDGLKIFSKISSKWILKYQNEHVNNSNKNKQTQLLDYMETIDENETDTESNSTNFQLKTRKRKLDETDERKSKKIKLENQDETFEEKIMELKKKHAERIVELELKLSTLQSKLESVTKKNEELTTINLGLQRNLINFSNINERNCFMFVPPNNGNNVKENRQFNFGAQHEALMKVLENSNKTEHKLPSEPSSTASAKSLFTNNTSLSGCQPMSPMTPFTFPTLGNFNVLSGKTNNIEQSMLHIPNNLYINNGNTNLNITNEQFLQNSFDFNKTMNGLNNSKGKKSDDKKTLKNNKDSDNTSEMVNGNKNFTQFNFGPTNSFNLDKTILEAASANLPPMIPSIHGFGSISSIPSFNSNSWRSIEINSKSNNEFSRLDF